jgi:cleavage and polyadenylation specificity factor subunit 3
VKRDFKYHIVDATDINKYTDMSMSTVTQRQSLAFNGSPSSLKFLLERIGGNGTVEVLDADKKYKVFENVEVTFDGKIVILEWLANPINDMFADTVLASLLQTDLCGSQIKGTTSTAKSDVAHLKECIIETLQEMFGENAVPKLFKGDLLKVTVNDKIVEIDLSKMDVKCEEDEVLRDTVFTAITKLNQVLVQTK